MPTGSLSGRAALVTGVGRRVGIGYAISRRLLESGASVFAHAWTPYDVEGYDVDPDEPDFVLSGLRGTGGRVEQYQADFAEPAAPSELFAAAREAFGQVDVLIVNHTRSSHAPLEELSAEDLDDCLHENVRA